MPPLLKSAGLKPDVTIIDDEEDKEQYADEKGWDFIPVYGQQVGIKTSVLEEKCTAYEMICCYAQELKGAFFPYVPEVLETYTIPGLKFYFHDGVRQAAAKCLPHLVVSAKEANPNNLAVASKIFRSAIDALLATIDGEQDVEMTAVLYESFYETVDVAGDSCLTLEDMNKFIEVTCSQLTDYGTRKTARDETIASGERDAEEDEEVQLEIDNDEILLSAISKSIHTIFKRHKSDFLPIWTRMVPMVDAGMASNEPTTRSWALCIIDDVIEFCNGEAFPFVGHYLQAIAASIVDECTFWHFE